MAWCRGHHCKLELGSCHFLERVSVNCRSAKTRTVLHPPEPFSLLIFNQHTFLQIACHYVYLYTHLIKRANSFFLFLFWDRRPTGWCQSTGGSWPLGKFFSSSREEISQPGIEPPTSSLRFGYVSTIIWWFKVVFDQRGLIHWLPAKIFPFDASLQHVSHGQLSCISERKTWI